MKNLLVVLAFCFVSSVHAQDLVRFSNGTFYRGESELNWLEFENAIISKDLSPKTLRKAIRYLHQSEYPVATTFKKLGIVYLDVLLAGAGAMTSAFDEPTLSTNILMVGGLTHGVYTLSTVRTKSGYYRKGAQLAQQAVEEYNAAIQPAP